MNGQMDLDQYLAARDGIFPSCSSCVCRNCLYWWSGRCPYGECFDDHRAKAEPYDKAHPGKPPRTGWSNWNKPGEQAHWCRGGTCYPIYYCDKFVKYTGCHVKECLEALVRVFQDGYIDCSIIDSVGCEECYKRLEERQGSG